jgi:hypothetical protein
MDAKAALRVISPYLPLGTIFLSLAPGEIRPRRERYCCRRVAPERTARAEDDIRASTREDDVLVGEDGSSRMGRIKRPLEG